MGYVAFSKEGDQLLIQVLDERRARKPVIITSSLRFGDWYKILGPERNFGASASLHADRPKILQKRKEGLLIDMMHVHSVTEVVVNHLKKKIITGEIEANQKLTENQLVEELGVSRPTLREAFRLLENMNLVVNLHRKGMFVTDITLDGFVELKVARDMIETTAIDILKEKNIRCSKDLKASLNIHHKLDVADNINVFELLEKSFSFHSCLVKSCGNKILKRFHDIILENMARYLFLYFKKPDSGKRSARDHVIIAEYIEEGKYGEAKKALKNHLDLSFMTINSFLLKHPQLQMDGVRRKNKNKIIRLS